jgi:hypothetical protein
MDPRGMVTPITMGVLFPWQKVSFDPMIVIIKLMITVVKQINRIFSFDNIFAFMSLASSFQKFENQNNLFVASLVDLFNFRHPLSIKHLWV